MMRAAVITTVISGLLLVGVPPAAADPPVRSTATVPFELTDQDCGEGLTYDVSATGDLTVIAHGDVERWYWRWRGEVVASDGTTASLDHTFVETYDLTAGTVTAAGKGFGTRVDDDPALQVYAGRLAIDLTTGELLFDVGRSSEGEFDPHEETCALILAAQA